MTTPDPELVRAVEESLVLDVTRSELLRLADEHLAAGGALENFKGVKVRMKVKRS